MKQYIKPNIQVYEFEYESVIAFSGQNNGKGNHNGWSNPNNPHYNGENSSEYRTNLWGTD